MPFANLPTHEKDAFFALLDEYFASRPDLLARGGPTSASEGAEMQSSIPAAPAAAAAFTAAQRALANPATSRALATGIQRAGSAVSGNLSSTASPPPVPPSRSASSAAVDNDSAPPINFGRVAAAAQAFSAVAVPPPRAANPPTHKQTDSSSGLVPQKKFGDVDVSSAGSMFRSLRGSTAAKNAPPAPVHTPTAFAAKKASTFAPPPVRRVSASPAAPVPEPEPEPEPEAEEEEAGEWVEVLYDYMSQDAGDLALREGERVRVTERTSSDWWTGEIGSRSGLFPATYVKLL